MNLGNSKILYYLIDFINYILLSKLEKKFYLRFYKNSQDYRLLIIFII